jgi:hypothetical protein
VQDNGHRLARIDHMKIYLAISSGSGPISMDLETDATLAEIVWPTAAGPWTPQVWTSRDVVVLFAAEAAYEHMEQSDRCNRSFHRRPSPLME